MRADEWGQTNEGRGNKTDEWFANWYNANGVTFNSPGFLSRGGFPSQVERRPRAPRTMIIPRFIAVSGFAVGGWLAGSAFREIWKAQWLQTSAAVLLLISLAFPVYTFVKLSGLIPIYSQRTQAWDAREAAIKQALLDDEVRVTVTAIDGLPVGGIRDFDPKEKAGYWITQCAAEYYGSNSMSCYRKAV